MKLKKNPIQKPSQIKKKTIKRTRTKSDKLINLKEDEIENKI